MAGTEGHRRDSKREILEHWKFLLMAVVSAISCCHDQTRWN